MPSQFNSFLLLCTHL